MNSRREAADTTWLAEIYDAHAPTLARYLSARAGAGSAEDLLSEVFEVALRRRHTFDEARGTPAAWLFGIATNILRQHRRQEMRHWQSLMGADDRPARSEDVSERAVEVADAQSAARELIPALQSLDPVDRDILLLISWGHLTPVEVASALDIPPGTVRSRLHRLRHKLRSALTPPSTAAEPTNPRGPIDHVAH